MWLVPCRTCCRSLGSAILRRTWSYKVHWALGLLTGIGRHWCCRWKYIVKNIDNPCKLPNNETDQLCILLLIVITVLFCAACVKCISLHLFYLAILTNCAKCMYSRCKLISTFKYLRLKNLIVIFAKQNWPVGDKHAGFARVCVVTGCQGTVCLALPALMLSRGLHTRVVKQLCESSVTTDQERCKY